MVELALYALAYTSTVFFVVFMLTPGFMKPKWGPLWFGVLVAWAVLFYDGFTGKPKDMDSEWRSVENSEIVTYRYVEPDDLYVWIIRPDTTLPVSYRIPFDINLVKRLGSNFYTKLEGESIYLKMQGDGTWSLSVRHPEPVTQEPDK